MNHVDKKLPRLLRSRHSMHLTELPAGYGVAKRGGGVILRRLESEELGAEIQLRPDDVPIPAANAANWITDAQWPNTTGSPISTFSAEWIVPPAPTSVIGQFIYIFNGLQPDNTPAILQPVLLWGPIVNPASGWYVSSYWVDSNGQAIRTAPVAVAHGTPLTGMITGAKNEAGSFDYQCQFSGIPDTQMQVSAIPELTNAYCTLEAYDSTGQNAILPRAQYPAVANLVMTAIDLETSTGPQRPTWTPDNQWPGNGSNLTPPGQTTSQVGSNIQISFG